MNNIFNLRGLMQLVLFTVILSSLGCGKLQINNGLYQNDRNPASASTDTDESPTEEFIILGHPGIIEPEPVSEEGSAILTFAKPAPKATISKLLLINTATGSVIRQLSNGSVINLDVDGTNLTIQAIENGTVESIQFNLDGIRGVDNLSPYALAGNNSAGGFNPASLSLGSHTLAVTPFAGDNASGGRGTTLQISLSVVQPSSAPTPTPTPEPTPTPSPTPYVDYQANVVNAAQAEANLALCGLDATNRYVAVAGSAWCSEFARWVYIQANVMTNSTSALWSIDSWSDFQNFFTGKGKFLSRSQIAPNSTFVTSMIGNYVLLDTNLDGVPNHSAIIVSVSADLTKIYTVEGNVSNCTKRVTRAFWVNGVLDPKVMGIGIIWP